MKKVYKVAYLVSHPIQYQAPLLKFLSKQPEINLTVFFTSDLTVKGEHDLGFGVPHQWDVPLLEGYNHVFLPVVGRRDRLSFWRPFAYRIYRHLKEGCFDALWIHGYAQQVNLRALVIAKYLGLKVLLRGESNLQCHSIPFIIGSFKRQVYSKIFNMIDGFLAIGTLNREFYLHYGVPPDRIFLMPYSVDNEFFTERISEAHKTREKFRAELGLAPNRAVILFASKLQPRKRARDLLEAYKRLSPDGNREPVPYLIFVGDGQDRDYLVAQAKKLGWASIKILGFKNQSELPRYYDLCDVFVLPSVNEPWGLVINEVMNAGKPIIVSDQVGAGFDLVKDGVNGIVVPSGDTSALADSVKRLTEEPALAQSMGYASKGQISDWNFKADLNGLMQALTKVIG